MTKRAELLAALDAAGAAPRPCDWPDGGCGALIREVITEGGRRQVVDADPAGKVVVVEVVEVGMRHQPTPDSLPGISDLALHNCARLGCRPVTEARSRVVDGWTDHHVGCGPWQARERNRRAERSRA